MNENPVIQFNEQLSVQTSFKSKSNDYQGSNIEVTLYGSIDPRQYGIQPTVHILSSDTDDPSAEITFPDLIWILPIKDRGPLVSFASLVRFDPTPNTISIAMLCMQAFCQLGEKRVKPHLTLSLDGDIIACLLTINGLEEYRSIVLIRPDDNRYENLKLLMKS